MRLMSLFLSVLLLSSVMFAQKKYLVSSHDEVIPLRRGESPASVIAKRSGRDLSSLNAVCTSHFTFGYPEDIFPATSNFGAYHKDVMGEWFVAPASGTVDTIFWEALGAVGALDSTLFMRVHKSEIGPAYGPGVRPGPFPPPCQNWGYWANTNDLDRGVAAFIEEATDTTWKSTILSVATPTRPPFSDLLWGFTGVPVIDHAGKINSIAMLSIGQSLPVVSGDRFFISQRVKGPVSHPTYTESRTEFAASGFRASTTDVNYPSRDWKFYEHDSGPSNCAGFNVNVVKRGWVARGGFTSDTLDVAVFNYWYAMTATSNTPPQVTSTTQIHSTLDNSDKVVDATVIDCDPAAPLSAGVASAAIKWFLNGAPQTDISMDNVGGDTWEGTIPAQHINDVIQYKVHALDNFGLAADGAPYIYQIAALGNNYVYVDTGASCTPLSIRTSGTKLDTSKFYLPTFGVAGNAAKLDDGTAGPIDIGWNMPMFGDNARYAWVGVNGGLALSKNNTDTVDVNSSGFYSPFSFPQINVRHGGRADTNHAGNLPGNFIAPLWADLYYGDSARQCGHIVYQTAPGGDTCLFVVEWDSLGSFSLVGGASCDEVTFRAILNRCDGTITYQYDDVGTLAEDSLASVGLQADSNAITVPNPALNRYPPYVQVNYFTYPIETKPRNGWCVKLYQGTTNTAYANWNLLSVGVVPIGSNYQKSVLYPTALGDAFYYQGAYKQVSSFPTNGNMANGTGYWMKFAAGQNVGARGALVNNLVVNTPSSASGSWSLIGTIGRSMPISGIQVAGTTVTSSYFGYGTQYYIANSQGPSPGNLIPGYGYWVKTGAAAGTLTMNGNVEAAPKANVEQTNFTQLNSINISDRYGRQQTLYIGNDGLVKEPMSMFEMPPVSPQFDARFSTQRMVETYPAHLDAQAAYQYPISVTTDADAYPLTVRWNVLSNSTGDRKLVLTTPDGKALGNTVMQGTGNVHIRDASVKNLMLVLSNSVGNMPKVFALGQNYPNPFNPSTRFEVQMPKTAEVHIAVYDILGQQVATLVNGQQQAGYLTVEWDGRDAHGLQVPTGIYFVRMTADEFTATRKIMLMK